MEHKLTLEEAKELVKIDKSILDEMCVGQSELYITMGDESVIARSISDEAKIVLEEESAKMAFDIRSQAEDEGVKITDKKVGEMVLLNGKHEAFSRNVIKTKLLSGLWSNREKAFLQRASMLGLIGKLELREQYTDVVVKKDLGVSDTEKQDYKNLKQDYKNLRKRIRRNKNNE